MKIIFDLENEVKEVLYDHQFNHPIDLSEIFYLYSKQFEALRGMQFQFYIAG